MPQLREAGDTSAFIARECGCLLRFSRALNGAYRVHKDTRKKVLAVASPLNYRPKRMVKGLVTGKSHTLGFLVVSDIRNPFLTEFNGAEDAAYAAGYHGDAEMAHLLTLNCELRTRNHDPRQISTRWKGRHCHRR